MKIAVLLALAVSLCFGQVSTGGLDVKARLNVGSVPFTISLPNSSTGTTNNKLAKVVNTAGVLQAQIITTSAADQASAIGCVISGGGTSGTALIMIAGTGGCYFDAATTAGHIAVPSSTSAGTLHDTGSASTPATGEVMATTGATNACGSPPCLIAGNLFMTPDVVATGGNGNGGGGGSGGGSKQQLHAVTFVLNGGSSNFSTGTFGLYPGSGAGNGTINRVDVSGAGAAGATCTFAADVWKANAAIPTSGGKISASAGPALTASNLAQSMNITTWTKAVAASDVWGLSVSSNTDCVSALIQIWYQ